MHESDLFCLFSCHCFSFRHFVEVFLEVYFLLFRSTLPQKRPSAYEKCNSLLVSRVYSICWAVSSAGWQILSLFPTCLSSYLILCLFNTLPCAGLQIIRPLMGSGYVHELTPKTFFNPGLFIFLQSPFYPPVITLAFAMSLLQHTVCRGKKVVINSYGTVVMWGKQDVTGKEFVNLRFKKRVIIYTSISCICIYVLGIKMNTEIVTNILKQKQSLAQK